MASQLQIPKPKHTINPTLTTERQKATFNPIKITNLFDNSSDQTKKRQYFEQLIRNDPSDIFSNEKNNNLHRKDRHIRSLAKSVRLIEIARSVGLGKDTNGEIVLDENWTTLVDSLGDILPVSLQWQMFVPNIISLADEEQKKVWLSMCRDWRMIGCYAQTEVGHGSNVRAIETTATFVKDDKDGHWIIHSPTITSWKFWPGSLGTTCNHAMVIAKLIDGEGVDHGVHNFLVQTRRLEDHTLMPGVICGDVGPKIGYNNMDNGFAKFDHVKIPRRNMAMGFAEVDKDGVLKKKIVSDAASKINYITMMQVRAGIVSSASKYLRMGITIAIRYSAVRKQGFKNEMGGNQEENQILDYKQQQYRLFPLLASSYCFFFTGKKIMSDLKVIEKRLVEPSSSNTLTKTEVADMHATLSCLKSFTTTICADGLEDCRKSCGGHGFLAASGFPELINSYLIYPTVEGDNAMLPVQVGKVLIKLVTEVQSNNADAIRQWEKCEAKYLIKPLKGMLSGEYNSKCEVTSKDDMLNIEVCLKAYQHRTARLLVEVEHTIQLEVMEGKSSESVWNGVMIQLGYISRAHSLYLLLNNFANGIKEESGAVLGTDEVNVLDELALLFGLYWIDKEDGEFLVDGYFSAKQIQWVRACVLTMLDKIRPNAVALVDANDFSDFILKSALGRFDGNVYEAILETSKKDPLNATEPGPGYEHLRRLIVDGVGVYAGTSSRL